MKIVAKIVKVLSPNDVGETGAHQAGILINKRKDILSFFPVLDPAVKNPRITLYFFEEDGITKWPFEYIYYNNRFFGGTRNEYRLTCMTPYLQSINAKSGDTLEMQLDSDGRRHIRLVRATPVVGGEVLVLRGGWKVIAL